MGRPRKVIKRLRPVATNCIFCKSNTLPDYKDAGMLGKYMTERGKILGRSRTGVCSKHQRPLARAIKRGRILSLVPFVVRA